MRAGERGVALVVVLWFVVAAATMSLTFVRHGQADLIQTRETLNAVQARALVDAGLARAVVEVARSRDRQAPPAGIDVVLDGGRADVRIEPEGGKIDLNEADAVLIGSLARVLGIEAERADAIGEAAVDWRDEGDLRQPKGAEDEDYEAAERPWGTPDAPFRSVAELRYLLPVDDSVYTLLQPFLTVYSGEARPRAQLAAKPVRQAMEQRSEPEDEERRGLPEDQAAAEEAPAPRPGSPAGDVATAGSSDAEDGGAQDRKHIYTLTVIAELAGGYRRAERAVVWLADAADGPPVRVLDRGMIEIAPEPLG